MLCLDINHRETFIISLFNSVLPHTATFHSIGFKRTSSTHLKIDPKSTTSLRSSNQKKSILVIDRKAQVTCSNLVIRLLDVT